MTRSGRKSVDLADLKSRHPLAETVEAAGVSLTGRGRVRQGVCPFHAEAEGSFTVYGDSERWHCFGCGAGGDVLDFVRRTEGVGLTEAIRRLQGSGGRVRESAPPRPSRDPVVHVRDAELLTEAARLYTGQLRESPEALGYLASRGIGPDVATRLGLGYAPGTGLRKHLAGAGFGGTRIARSGLLTGRTERFGGMIVVPEAAGRHVGWMAGRAISAGASPRFQALPGPKPVLGLTALGPEPPLVIVTEGLFDWIVLRGWGLPACAALGTQGERRVAEALAGCGRVVIIFDADDAGREGAARLRELLGGRGAVTQLPHGAKDAADLATMPGGRAALMKAFGAAETGGAHRGRRRPQGRTYRKQAAGTPIRRRRKHLE